MMLIALFFTLVSLLTTSLAQDTAKCASLNCTSDKYCFEGTQELLCLACNTACVGCNGPGPKECKQCAVGFFLSDGTCTGCTNNQFGADCNGTCHCLDDSACNTRTGACIGKCAKGYAPPPLCQKECQAGFYGLDCQGQCHCVNDSVCHKESGICPNNLCHQDWIGAACRKRLPMLSSSPSVADVSCQYFTVQWRGWDVHLDFGDPQLPINQYWLYSRFSDSNDSDSDTWQLEAKISHDPNVTHYTYNVTALRGNAYYQFRVDAHGTDDGKLVQKTSVGLVSEPPLLTPCATTTVPPPVTVPIVVGAEIFTDLSATLQLLGNVLVRWTIDTQFLQYSWNLTLSFQLIGVGDCAVVPDGNVTSVSVDQSDTEFSMAGLEPWSRYRVVLRAQGLGIVSAANDTEEVSVSTAELAPNNTVSQPNVLNNGSTNVTLGWTDVACADRRGLLLRYDVSVRPWSSGGASRVLTSNVTSLLVTNLKPFMVYAGRVRYVNKMGLGPYSPEFLFPTAQGVPAGVIIDSLEATANTVEVKVRPPDPVNGELLEYYILYSDTATFTLPESLTFSASSPGNPVVIRLSPYTIYYFKARGKTGAGYGPYGSVMYTRTLQARPHPPSSLLQTQGNLTCVTMTWLTPDQSAVAITGYTLTLVNTRTGQGSTVTLDANSTSYTQCDLEPGSAYTLSMTSRSGAGLGQPTSLQVSTVQLEPPSPPSPTLVEVAPTFASVEIEPVTLTPGVEVAYQLQMERVGAARRKRLAVLPGYVTAQLSGQEVKERLMVVIGDGKQYGSYTNRALDPGTTYNLYYVVLSTFNNLTKSNYTRMNTPIRTPLPTTTTVTTTPTMEPVTEGPSPEDDNGVLVGVIVGLILLILLIILIIVFILWWRRRKSLLLQPPPYLELEGQKEVKVKDAEAKEDVHENEKYWNQTTSLRESRYIVVGRECVPDSQLVPVSTQMPQPGAPKITFRKEFRSLPKDHDDDHHHHHPRLNKAATTTRKNAERYPDRNRFPHILPYDHTLVELQPDASSRCSYINASFMSGYKRRRFYIAAQSPYDERTAVDFWRLIHQNRIKTVLLVANGVEDHIVKCTQYWPREGKARMGQFYLELREEWVYADFTVREVMVRESGEAHARSVRLYDCTSWPDHGVPQDPVPFLHLRYKVRQYHGDEPGPILVHCGTGVGRTGVFIAVDSLLDQYSAEGRVSVFSFVRKMRKERPLMVRTLKQYQFVYDCLLEEFQAGDTMVDASSIKNKYRDWTSKNAKTGRSFLRDQFQLLHRLTEGPAPDQCRKARLPENAKRNRYPDVIPSDLYRPELFTPAKFANTDYINALFVDGYRNRKQFIVTQTPLHTTLVDLWRLVYDHHVTTVVMMDRYRHEDDTCAQYWPEEVSMKQWEPFFVESTAAFQQDDVTIRNLKVVNSQSPQEPPLMVRQFQFNAWAPNSFVPASKTMLLDLLDMVTEHQASSDHPHSPIVVHCQDGATHSGIFVCLALLCERMEEEEEVDVYHVIKQVKRRRPQIIPDYEQLRFCYRTLWDSINRMPGGTFTEDTMGQTKLDTLYGPASLSLTSHHGTSLY
ncbi:hypothetical protein ACOMHN_053542 [Nucella lapillus]